MHDVKIQDRMSGLENAGPKNVGMLIDRCLHARQSASVPIKLMLHSSQSSRYTAASTLRCTSSADRTSTSSQRGRRAFAVAGPTLFNAMPDDLLQIPQSAHQPSVNR